MKNKISKKKSDFLDMEFGVFFHFGIRTFYEGHDDWDGKPMPIEGFKPTELNCENWISCACDAGAKYAILVCKHHDGFANWPSKYTDYAIHNTSYKNGKGDIVDEFVKACRKYGLAVGLYYSPAQEGYKEISDNVYDEFFINQISELLTNYGKIDYLWFDGCGSENHKYDIKRIVDVIRRLQPDILLFNMWDPDTRWVGNESGIAPIDCKYVTNRVPFSEKTTEDDELGEDVFLPYECDCCIRDSWFYNEKDNNTVKSVDELVSLYYYSVGNGGNLLLNLSPDRRGLIPEKDRNNLLGFGKEIKKRFSDPVQAERLDMDDGITLTFDEMPIVEHIVLKEDLTGDDFVTEFDIYIQPNKCGEKGVKIYSGKTIGHKRIVKIPPISLQSIRIVCRSPKDQYKIDKIYVYEKK